MTISDRHLELIAMQATSNHTSRELAAELLATRRVARKIYQTYCREEFEQVRIDMQIVLAVLQERERSQM